MRAGCSAADERLTTMLRRGSMQNALPHKPPLSPSSASAASATSRASAAELLPPLWYFTAASVCVVFAFSSFLLTDCLVRLLSLLLLPKSFPDFPYTAGRKSYWRQWISRAAVNRHRLHLLSLIVVQGWVIGCEWRRHSVQQSTAIAHFKCGKTHCRLNCLLALSAS